MTSRERLEEIEARAKVELIFIEKTGARQVSYKFAQDCDMLCDQLRRAEDLLKRAYPMLPSDCYSGGTLMAEIREYFNPPALAAREEADG